MERDWSMLPDDILQHIGDRVAIDNIIDDYIRFRAVCTSWRSATFDPRDREIPQLPWLMLTFNVAFDKTRSFYRHSDDKIITLDLPEVLSHRIVGSSDGWLVLVHGSGPVRLFNPLNKAQINLPALTTLPWVLEYHEDDVGEEYTVEFDSRYQHDSHDSDFVRDYFVDKVVTNFSGEENGGDAMLVAMLFGGKLVFARVGDDKWTVVEHPHTYHDILFYRGKLYAVDLAGRELIAVDIGLCPSIRVTTITAARDEGENFTWCYLTPMDQGLLLVGRVHDTDDYYYCVAAITERFEVFKVDNLDGDISLTRVESLGDWVLFLGTNRAMSFNVKDHRGWKKDCIYFTQSEFHYISCDYRGVFERGHGGDDFGVFSLKDSSVETLPHCRVQKLVLWPPPIWFSPKICHQTMSSNI